jgi:hypothetical protein
VKELFQVIGAAMVLLFMTNFHIRGQFRHQPVKKIRLEPAPGSDQCFDHIVANAAGF